jgi:hypothetical protein
MVDSVLAMPKAAKKLTELDMPDRCWLVAGLTAHGWTAKRIAEVTGCSERLSKAIRAEPAYQVAMIVHEELKELMERFHAESSEHSNTRRELQLCRAEGDRVRAQMNQLVKKLCAGETIATCYRGHPILEGSTYRHGNRDYCRECNRENSAAYRKRKQAPGLQRHSIRMTATHPSSVASGA